MNYLKRKALSIAMFQSNPGESGGGEGTEATAEEGTKRKSIKVVDADLLAQGTYKATFNDGTVVVASLADIKEEHREAMIAKFLAYGLKQKLDDSMAGAEDTKEAIEELTSTWDSIVQGGWTSRVPGEGVEGGLFARAYSERHRISLGDAKAKIGTLVAKNLAANVEKNRGKKDAAPITERMVLNAIRSAALERDTALNAKYEELKAKKKKKASGKQVLDVDLG